MSGSKPARRAGAWRGLRVGAAAFLLSALAGGFSAGSVAVQEGSEDMPWNTSFPEGDLKPTGCFVTYGFRWPPEEGWPDFPCVLGCEWNGEVSAPVMDDRIRDLVKNICFAEGPNSQYTLPLNPNCTVWTGPRRPSIPLWHTWYPEGSPFCKQFADDPHARTFDGVRYDLQAAGEFVGLASMDDGLEVQYRLEPVEGSLKVSYITAAAARVGERRVVFGVHDAARVRVDGQPVEFPERNVGYVAPDGDALLVRDGDTYSIVWPDGSNLHIAFYRRNLNAFFLPSQERDGRLTGLFGDGDGDGANDFRTRDGRLLASPPDFSVLYGTFAESWRVRPGESLFDYAPGESTDTFTDRSIPEGPATLADLPPADRARAEAACRGGGVTDPAILEDCIVDVGFSGDESFIASALDRQTPAVFVAPPDPMPEPIVSGLCRPAAAAAAAFSFRADAGRAARYPGALRRFEGEQQWSAQGFRPGHDPLAVGDRVLAARERGLAALDAETGQIAWEVASPGGRIAGPGLLAAGGTVFVAWTDDLAAYDLEAGTECWRLPVGPATSPAFADGRLFVSVPEGGSGYAAAVDAASGRILWRYHGRHPSPGNWPNPSAPTAGGGAVFVADGPEVVALDPASGEPRWRATTGGLVSASLTYADGVLYVPTGNRGLHALDATTGSPLWVWSDPGAGNLHASLALSDDLVFVVDERHLHAIERKSGGAAWSADGARLDMYHSPVVAGDRLFTITQDGALVVFDARRGAELHRIRASERPAYGPATPTPGDRLLYFVLPDGKLYALR